MNAIPQVDTVEISDADLDNVSGGLSTEFGAAAEVVTPLGTVGAKFVGYASLDGLPV